MFVWAYVFIAFKFVGPFSLNVGPLIRSYKFKFVWISQLKILKFLIKCFFSEMNIIILDQTLHVCIDYY